MYKFIPIPRQECIFTLILSIGSFTLGRFKGETALLIISFLLIVPIVYSFICVALLAVMHKRRVRSIAVKINPEKLKAGEAAAIFLEHKEEGGGKPAASSRRAVFFFELPAVLVRYKIELSTKDKKSLIAILGRDFFLKREAALQTKKRGAFFGEYDTVIIRDMFGFFYVSHKIYCGKNARLFVSPEDSRTAQKKIKLKGGSRQRDDAQIILTDDFIEQRPYVPGDDPRRINWKLYGHLGDLFVRQEEREPPPHAKLTVLICSESSSHNARDDVDMLCSFVFVIVKEAFKKGVEAYIASCGEELLGGDIKLAAQALSIPYSAKIGSMGLLPEINGEKEIMIFALPRNADSVQASSNKNALDIYLNKRPYTQNVNILFVYNRDELAAAAMAEELRYGRMDKVYARALRV